MEREVKPLLNRKGWGWRLNERERDGRRFRFFEDGADMALVCGGIGSIAGRRAAEAMVALYSPAIIYSVGFAGAADPTLKVGDVVQPSVVIDASDGSRVSLKEGSSVLVSFGAVASPVQKAKLREAYGAQIVDMEAAAVGCVAQMHGIEFAAVKSVSDEFDFAFPEMSRFVDSEGQFQQGQFARFAAVRPWLWWKVSRLAVNSNVAADGLNDWLIASLNRIVASVPQGEALVEKAQQGLKPSNSSLRSSQR